MKIKQYTVCVCCIETKMKRSGKRELVSFLGVVLSKRKIREGIKWKKESQFLTLDNLRNHFQLRV